MAPPPPPPESRLDALVAAVRAGGAESGAVAGWDAGEARRRYARLAASRLRASSLPLAAAAVEALARNVPDTVRGVMYALVSSGRLPDTSRRSYNRVQRLLNVLRKAGIVPFEWVVDTIRETVLPPMWPGLGAFADAVRGAYRRDLWADLPVRVEVVVEKDTVAGKLAPVTTELGVPLHPLRGYSSTSFGWSVARSWRGEARPIACYYVGDHDPSGRDIERSIAASIRQHAGRPFAWRRLAVEPAQFDQFAILPLAAKRKDSRYAKFVARYGAACAEVEAIPAAALRGLVRAAVESHAPAGRWAELKAQEAEERARWARLIDGVRGEAS